MGTHKPVIVEELFGELKTPQYGERWEVVHTKPRCEKKLAEFAIHNGIAYYLPQMEKQQRYQRRLVTTTLPMFPGYIFCVLDEAGKRLISSSGLSVSFLQVKSQQELITELQNIHQSRKPEIGHEQTLWLSAGLRVEITSGPLMGVTGIVESHDKLNEVHLQVDILRRAVLVRVDPKHVKVLGDYQIVDVQS